GDRGGHGAKGGRGRGAAGPASSTEVVEAAREMAARLARSTPLARLDGFVVQETVRGEAEVIVGARRDPQFGPVVLVGLGGIAVEILKDIALAPAPVTLERARLMLDALAGAPLFRRARGRPPLGASALPVALGPRLADFEVNPLIARPQGEGAIALDSRATLTETFHKEPHP